LEAQSFKDFDVLIWDNDSTDGTTELLHEWIPAKLSGRVVSNEPLTYDASLARLVQEADYEYLVRLDADDIAYPLRIEQQLAFLEENPDVAVVGGQMETIDENGRHLGFINLPDKFFEILLELLWRNPIPHPGVMMRRESVLSHGNYRELRPVEDLDLWIRIASTERLSNLPTTVIKYRHHSFSVTHLSKSENTHMKCLSNCIENEVPKFYPISSDDLKKLRNKKHYLAIIQMLKIAYYISYRDRISFYKVITSSCFIEVSRCLTARGDLISKVCYRMAEYLNLIKKVNARA
jgi:glycosyltransferase involved in cell wall biosynthesis